MDGKKKKKVDWLAYHMRHRKDVKKRNEEKKEAVYKIRGERCASD